MPSYNKSFNFRNGVQVDEDNFIVNPNGLVGIGTSIPTEFLDVYGTAKITGLVTARNLAVTGVSTFYSDVKIGSGVAVYASTGIVSATAFYGDASKMTGVEQIAIDGWIINAGNISTTFKVGIGTTLPSSQLDVVGDVKVSGIVTALGFGGYQALVGTESSAIKTFSVKVASKTSNHRYTGSGSANAYFIDGIESPFLTLLPGKTYRFDQSDASNIDNRLSFYLEADGVTPYNTNITTSAEVPGTSGSYTQITVTDTTPVVLHYQSSSSAYMGNAVQFNSNIVNTPHQITTLAGISATTGVVTAYSFSGFGTNIQGINATNITNGTLNNSRLPQSINIAGIITASSGIITSITVGFATLGITSISDLTVGGGATINSNLNVGNTVDINSAGIFAPTGIITASTFVGGLVGIASTARDLTSDARVDIVNIQSQTSSIGISTVSTRLYAERIGVGTNSPSGDIHIRRPGQSILQVTSDTEKAIVAVGKSTNLIGSNGALIFGNTSELYSYSNSKTLDIVNYDTGNLNYYLHYGIDYEFSGVGTGNYNWFYSQNRNTPLMSLTYTGNLGLGITNPTNKLQVSGNISASSLSLTGNINSTVNINSTGSITAIGAGSSTSVRSLYVYEGKSGLLNSDGTQIFPPGGDDNLNITSGISTFYEIDVLNQGSFVEIITSNIGSETGTIDTFLGIGIDTIDEDDLVDTNLLVAGNSRFIGDMTVFSPIIATTSVGIGTTTIEDEDTTLYVVGNSEFYGDMTVSGNITANNVNSLTLATAQNVSGLETSVDFTGIPSWVKRVTVMFGGVSTNGTSLKLVQIGSGSFTTTGYVSSSAIIAGATGFSASSSTDGFIIRSDDTADNLMGTMTINLLTGNTYVSSHSFGDSLGTYISGYMGGGNVTLSGTLDRVRITTVNGTDTFDEGTINIMYE